MHTSIKDDDLPNLYTPANQHTVILNLFHSGLNDIFSVTLERLFSKTLSKEIQVLLSKIFLPQRIQTKVVSNKNRLETFLPR